MLLYKILLLTYPICCSQSGMNWKEKKKCYRFTYHIILFFWRPMHPRAVSNWTTCNHYNKKAHRKCQLDGDRSTFLFFFYVGLPRGACFLKSSGVFAAKDIPCFWHPRLMLSLISPEHSAVWITFDHMATTLKTQEDSNMPVDENQYCRYVIVFGVQHHHVLLRVTQERSYDNPSFYQKGTW